jgi:hypothetical protein
VGALPPLEPASLAVLGLALAFFALAPRLARGSERVVLFGAATLAALLSAAYVVLYLRGGPRIIDATTYWFEGRALAAGHLAVPLEEPEASTLGRFLVRVEGADGPAFAGIFPPGYPALLALGFLAGAPLAVGPALAFALVLTTYVLAKKVLPSRATEAPRLAALLSVSCAALRYHTADTMSHGLAALCFAGALAAFFVASDAPSKRGAITAALGSGLLLGWLAATRPPSALALAACLVFALFTEAPKRCGRATLATCLALGLVPGLALLLAHQHAATGAWLTSSQRVYYAVSDGPAGCFRYGFGAGIGCVGEHGDFVRANLQHGFGPWQALLTTLRRLKMHLVDAGNAEPLALVVLFGVVAHRSERRVRIVALGLAGLVLAYAPFYFDGNYPGGGARFFADGLPLEHALLAFGGLALADRLGHVGPRARSALVPVALGAFTLRASFDHASLRERDGGAPMAKDDVLAPARAARGLVFFDTDHGFALALDPADSPPFAVARYRGDALDTLRRRLAGEPPTFRYRFDLGARGGGDNGQLEPYLPSVTSRIEGESLWPARAQRRGFALPSFEVPACVSAGRALALHADSGGVAIDLTLAPGLVAGRSIAPRLALASGVLARVAIRWPAGEHTWEPTSAPPGGECLTLPRFALPAGSGPFVLSIEADGDAPLALDALLLESD